MTRVLIVDDEEDLRMLMSLILRKVGYETLQAESGEDLFAKIGGFLPDIILLDVVMQGMQTTEILQRLREKSGDPPVILITVLRFSETERAGLFGCGHVVGYIAKPFDVHYFIGTIDKQLGLHHSQVDGCNTTVP